jgi:cystathionine beta-synthase/cysteine synthase A
MKYPTILDTIGKTPLVRLQNICPNPLVTILVKVEFMNPGSSIKDRIVLHIINNAEKCGLLKPGGTIIENTSGNTGAAVAMIAAIRGYKAILTMPDKVSKEKQNALKAFGAEIIICPTGASPDSPEHYVNVAKKLASETPHSFRINQYDNPKNPEAHYQTTAVEIWEQTQGDIDYFIASGSTGGTVSGIGKYLKERKPNVQVILPDPIGSIYHQYFKTKSLEGLKGEVYFVEGIGEDHIAEAIDFNVINEVMPFEDIDAFAVCRLLARKEGILAGGSSGANVWAALEVAKKMTKPTTIVTILPDGGVKYLSKIYDEEWLQKNQLLKQECTV